MSSRGDSIKLGWANASLHGPRQPWSEHWRGAQDAIRHALWDYFDTHEDARLAAAIHLYDADGISLGEAARLAGVSRFDMPELLRDHGIDVGLGPGDMEDAHREIDVARDLQ